MSTTHVGTIARRSAAFFLLLAASGCTKSEPETAAEQFCGTLADYVKTCAAASTPCDQALVNDCASVTGFVSDSFLQSATDCLKSGEQPLICIGKAAFAVKATAAHEKFAAQFCDECALGVGGCEDVLLGRLDGPSELLAATGVILALGDTLVDALREECATGLGCLATFPTCAQKVLLEQAIPDETVQCLLDNLTGKAAAAAPEPDPNVPACGLGGEGSSGSGSVDPSATGSGSTPTSTGETGGETSGGSTQAHGETSTGAPDPTNGESNPSNGESDPSDPTNTDDTGVMTGPDPDTGDTGDTGWEELCAEPYSMHDECGVGVALPEECTWCSYLVCTYFDDYCCTTAWDELCQAKAQERCSAACGANTDQCAHSPCMAGVALNRGCSDCVIAVCAGKPECCDVEWTDECASMATACGIC